MLLTEFYLGLRRDGGRGGGELGWTSVKRVHATLSSALTTAERRGVLPSNPAKRADLPPKPQPDARAAREGTEFQVFSPSELSEFLRYVPRHRLGGFFHLAACTGARRGELCHLRWQDIDLDGLSLRIRGSRAAVGGKVIDGPTKTRRTRTVSLDPATVAVLRQHRQRQLEDRLRAGVLWVHEDDFVFRQESGAPIWPETPSSLMVELCRGAGVPRRKLHELRHTHATILLNAGVPVHEVAARLGHANAHETLNTYARVIKARQDLLGDRFAAALGLSS